MHVVELGDSCQHRGLRTASHVQHPRFVNPAEKRDRGKQAAALTVCERNRPPIANRGRGASMVGPCQIEQMGRSIPTSLLQGTGPRMMQCDKRLCTQLVLCAI